MTDRDHFAAAALTGIIANEGEGPSLSNTCGYAYRIADAMLRERNGAVEGRETVPITNHDAVPAAKDQLPEGVRASVGGGSDRTDNAAPRPAVVTGNTSSGAACAPHADGRGGIPRCPDEPPDVTQPDNGLATSGRGRNTQYPAAWVAFAADGSESSAVYSLYEQARAAADEWNWCVAPLYCHPHPTLTDAEREAIEKAIGRELDAEWYGGPEPDRVVVLRGLLERLG